MPFIDYCNSAKVAVALPRMIRLLYAPKQTLPLVQENRGDSLGFALLHAGGKLWRCLLRRLGNEWRPFQKDGRLRLRGLFLSFYLLRSSLTTNTPVTKGLGIGQ